MKQDISLLASVLILTAAVPLGARAATNTWNNASQNGFWDTFSANWTSPTTWNQDDDAIFGATGAGPITLGVSIGAKSMTFLAPGYSITGAGSYLTNTMITAGAGTYNELACSMWGEQGLVINGPGTNVLLGDAFVNDANHYTGGTYIHGGTTILNAPGVNSSGTSYALDSVEALDAGATLVIPGTLANGVDATGGVIYHRDQVSKYGNFIMTGGTLDFNNEPKQNQFPVPQGTGLIVNQGAFVQAGCLVIISTNDAFFSGVIADGNNGVLATNNNFNSGPGYQIGILQLNSINGGGGAWHLSGSNTFSGSTRIAAGAQSGIILDGAGTIGFPTPNGLTGPLRIYDGYLDLHGHNQTIALMTGGNAGGRIFNSATGTVSTLTFGYGNEQANRNAPYLFEDNEGTGGILALRKIISAPYPNYGATPPYSTMATNCAQTLSGVCAYSGDTTVAGGSLILNAVQSVSPNSAYRLSTANYGLLMLNYAGDAPVRQLWIDGVQQPNGTYGTGTPGIDPASTGTITVTGYAPATLRAAQVGNTVNLSWEGIYKLQVSVNSLLGPWVDVSGAGMNSASVPINPAVAAAFYRLATY